MTTIEMQNDINEAVYTKAFDTGYKTAISDLAYLYKDSPDEFYKLLSPSSEPLDDMAQEEKNRHILSGIRPHRKHKWQDGIFENVRDFSLANPHMTWNELSNESEIGFTGEAIKRKFLNNGIGSYKYRPVHTVWST